MIRRRLLNQDVVAALRARRPARARAAAAPRGRGGRRRHAAGRGPGGGARGGAGGLAPPGAGALRGGRRARRPAGAARARGAARRLRLGALQRAPVPRGGRRRARRPQRLYEELGEPVALALCLVRLSRHLFMAGETDAAEEARSARCGILRHRRRRRGAGLRDARTWARSWP